MLEGVKGPPTVPVDVSPSAGVTPSPPEVGATVMLTGRMVVQFPFVVSTKVTESLYVAAGNWFAWALIVTVTTAVAAGASVPLDAESVSQGCVFEAVQSSAVPPVF
jgi:hypothetical protein